MTAGLDMKCVGSGRGEGVVDGMCAPVLPVSVFAARSVEVVLHGDGGKQENWGRRRS